MRPVTQSRSLVAGAVGAIAASQTTAGAGNLLINGTLAANGVATLAAQQQIGITSAGNDSAITFTITGTDSQGRVISESLAGPNINTVVSVFSYLTVTQIAVNGAVASAVTADTITQGAGSEIPLDLYLTPFQLTLTIEVTGTVNVTAQFTVDDVFGGAPGPFIWFPVTSLTNIAATTSGTIVSPVRAVRLQTNSGAGTAKFIVDQAGIQ